MNRIAPIEKRDRSYADAAAWIVILLLSAAFVLMRVRTNGNLNDSVAAQDTRSYFDCAGRNFLSREAYTCGRSATLPLLYSLLTPNGEYELTVMAEPFFGSEARLAVQPGTEKIVRFQLILSIAGWLIFSWSAASLFRNAAVRIVSVLLLLTFAFVPQLSDWDSILLSESISFSLFILMSAFWLRFLNAVFKRGENPWEIAVFTILFLISAVPWTFTRDTNAYFLAIVALCCLIIGFVILRRKRIAATAASILTSLFLTALFLFQQSTFRESERWLLPMLNNYTGNVFPYESRVEWFLLRGMPVSDTLLQASGSAEYNEIYQEEAFMEWIRTDGTERYIGFMIDHPLLTLQSVYFQMDEFFAENIQPFFYGAEEDKPRWSEPLGNLLHPLSSSLMLIVPGLWLILVRKKAAQAEPIWIVFLLVLTVGGFALTVIAYLGEVRSVWRHVLSGVLMLRLGLWLTLLALLDVSDRREIRISRNE